METIQVLYEIHDAKAENYTPPFNETNDATAIRRFKISVNNPDMTFNHHPEDYSLWRCGHHDGQTGRIHEQEPILIARAFDLIERQQGNQFSNAPLISGEMRNAPTQRELNEESN